MNPEYGSRMLPRNLLTHTVSQSRRLYSEPMTCGTGQFKCEGTRAETTFRLSAKWMIPFKSAGASVQSTTGSRGVHISGSNAGYSMFQGSVKGTGYPLHSPVSPSFPLQCITVCHHISLESNLKTENTGHYRRVTRARVCVCVCVCVYTSKFCGMLAHYCYTD